MPALMWRTVGRSEPPRERGTVFHRLRVVVAPVTPLPNPVANASYGIQRTSQVRICGGCGRRLAKSGYGPLQGTHRLAKQERERREDRPPPFFSEHVCRLDCPSDGLRFLVGFLTEAKQ
jgi:hypothetical protein